MNSIKDVGSHPGTPAPNVYQSVDALAEELGISRQSAYAGLRKGTIPSIRIGKRFIIPKSAISDWLRNAGGNLRLGA